jgi:RNA polymerase sigma-70 factor (ECF subfamily)
LTPLIALRGAWKEAVIDQREDVVMLFNAHAAELWRGLLVVAGGRGDLAEEATAEAFSRLLASRHHVREPRAWLYRTGLRIVVTELRRERWTGAGSEAAYADPGASELSPELTDALRSLSANQRLAVFLAYQADLPLSEVAHLTGSSVAAVKVRLHRARKALRTQLEENVRV